jgi:hypothetical protein
MLNSDTSIPLSRALRAVHARAARLAARAEDYRRVAIAAETEAHRIIVNAERAEAQRRVSGRVPRADAIAEQCEQFGIQNCAMETRSHAAVRPEKKHVRRN